MQIYLEGQKRDLSLQSDESGETENSRKATKGHFTKANGYAH